MKDKRFTVEKNDKYIAILDEGKSIGNTYHVCALLNKQHETIQSLTKQNKRLHDDLHKINQIARGY